MKKIKKKIDKEEPKLVGIDAIVDHILQDGGEEGFATLSIGTMQMISLDILEDIKKENTKLNEADDTYLEKFILMKILKKSIDATMNISDKLISREKEEENAE